MVLAVVLKSRRKLKERKYMYHLSIALLFIEEQYYYDIGKIAALSRKFWGRSGAFRHSTILVVILDPQLHTTSYGLTGRIVVTWIQQILVHSKPSAIFGAIGIKRQNHISIFSIYVYSFNNNFYILTTTNIAILDAADSLNETTDHALPLKRRVARY